MSTKTVFGLGNGKVYAYQAARLLLNALRHLIISPSDLVRFLHLTGHERLLEIGCRPGYFRHPLDIARPQGQLLFDLQLQMLQMAGARWRAQSLALAVHGNALAQPLIIEQRGDADFLSPTDLKALAQSASFTLKRARRGRFGLNHIAEFVSA